MTSARSSLGGHSRASGRQFLAIRLGLVADAQYDERNVVSRL